MRKNKPAILLTLLVFTLNSIMPSSAWAADNQNIEMRNGTPVATTSLADARAEQLKNATIREQYPNRLNGNEGGAADILNDNNVLNPAEPVVDPEAPGVITVADPEIEGGNANADNGMIFAPAPEIEAGANGGIGIGAADPEPQGVGVIMPLPPAPTRTLTVKKDGTGDFTSIQACANAAIAGDACEIHAGVYDEKVSITNSGTADKRITFKANGTAEVNQFTISGAYIVVDGLNFNIARANVHEGGIYLLKGAHNGFYQNLTMNGTALSSADGAGGVHFGTLDSSHALNNKFFNIEINNPNYHAVSVGGTNTLMDGFKIFTQNGWDIIRVGNSLNAKITGSTITASNEAETDTHSDIIQSFNDGGDITAKGLVFENNVVLKGHDYQFGNVTDDQEDEDISGWTFHNNVLMGITNAMNLYAPGFTFTNNTFYRCGATSNWVIIHGSSGAGHAHNLTVKNNIFFETGDPTRSNGGWYAGDPVSNLVGNNNLVFGFGAGGIKSGFNEAPILNRSANPVQYFSGNGVNPLFVDAPNGNFNLRSGSLAIGNGSDGLDIGANLTPLAPDTEAPTTPVVSATAISSSRIRLTWDARATDNRGVTGYEILRGTTSLGIIHPTFNSVSGEWIYTDLGLTASTNYTYTIKAVDAAGNKSLNPATVSVTTPVREPNIAPVVEPIVHNDVNPLQAGVQVYAGSTVNLSGSATDGNDEDTLTYRWFYKVNGGTEIALGETQNVTFNYPADAADKTYIFILRVSDGQLTNEQTLTVQVLPPPEADTTTGLISPSPWNFNSDPNLTGGSTWNANDNGRDGVLSFGGDDQATLPTLGTDFFSTQRGSTISAWVKVGSLPSSGWQGIVTQGGNNGTSWWGLFVDNANNRFQAIVGGQVLNGPENVTENTWYHLAITQDASGLKFFINDEILDSSNIPVNAGNNAGLRFGVTEGFEMNNPANKPPEHFNGSIDGVRAYERALTADDIRALVREVIPPPVNNTPVANNQRVSLDEDVSKTITLEGSGGGNLRYIINLPLGADGKYRTLHGTLTPTGQANQFTYAPDANYNGDDSFTFKVNNGTADSAVATVSLTVAAVNDAPTLDLDPNSGFSVALQPYVTQTIELPPVSSGDPEPVEGCTNNEDGCSFLVWATSSNDSVIANNFHYDYETNTLSYVTRGVGTATITVSVDDGENRTSKTFVITVTPPVITETANSWNFDSDPRLTGGATWSATDNGRTGVLSFNGTNQAIVDDGLGAGFFSTQQSSTISTWVKVDAFTGRWQGIVTQGGNNSGWWWLGLNPSGKLDFIINKDPSNPTSVDELVANNLTISVKTWYHIAVVQNKDDNTLKVFVNGEQQQLSVNGGQPVLSHTAVNAGNTDPLYFGNTRGWNEHFIGTIDGVRADTRALSVAEVQSLAGVVVVPNLYSPIIETIAAQTTNEDTPRTGIIRASDADGDALTYSVNLAGTKGSVMLGVDAQGNRTFTYTPPLNLSGPDSFVILVSDGKGKSATQTVNVNIAAVNDAPVFARQSFNVIAGQTFNGTLVTDVDSPSFTYSSPVGTTLPSGLALNANGTFSYTTPSNFTGPLTFQVKVSDGIAEIAATITLLLPIHIPASYILMEGDSLTEGRGATDGETYPAQLATLLPGNIFENIGLSGDKIEKNTDASDTISHLLAADSTQKRTVIVMFGVNDIAVNNSVAKVAADLATWIRTVRAADSGVFIVGMTLFPISSFNSEVNPVTHETLNHRLAQLNALIKTTLDPLHPDDKFDAVVDLAADPSFTDADYLATDGLHLNNDGYEIMALHVKATLESNGRIGSANAAPAAANQALEAIAAPPVMALAVPMMMASPLPPAPLVTEDVNAAINVEPTLPDGGPESEVIPEVYVDPPLPDGGPVTAPAPQLGKSSKDNKFLGAYVAPDEEPAAKKRKKAKR